MLGYKYITCEAINMKQDILHYPNLKTVLEVEEIIKNSEMPLTRYKILKKLKNKIMKQTLNVVISYLDDKGIIYDSKKGILWTYQPKEKLEKRIKVGLSV
jgi:hypothetical protein